MALPKSVGEEAVSVIVNNIKNKQNILTAGDGIEIKNNVISASGSSFFIDSDGYISIDYNKVKVV